MTTPLDLDSLDPTPKEPASADDNLEYNDEGFEAPIVDELGENEPLEGVDETGQVLQQPQEEPPQETQSQGGDDQGKNDTVPLATFLEEKGRVKAMKEELDQLRTSVQTMQQFKEQYDAQAQQPQVEPEQPQVDYYDDPQAYVQNLEQQVRELRESQAQQQEQVSNEKLISDFKVMLQTEAQQFANDNADFLDAYKYVREKKASELKAMGYTDEAQIGAYIDQWELQSGYTVKQNGGNFAQNLYNFAKDLGYNQKPPANNERLETLKQGQQSNSNLGTGGAPASAPKVTEDEFDAAFNHVFGHLKKH